ncbi:hypothetical protein D3C80_844390 [compost metagenome]
MPLYSDLKYRYGMSLEGISWDFTFYWTDRSSTWHMDIRDEESNPIVLGHRVVAQYPMMLDYTLEDYGLTGHFVLLPTNTSMTSTITLEPEVMPEFFRLFYVYNTGG